jgi:hypothetical protein
MGLDGWDSKNGGRIPAIKRSIWRLRWCDFSALRYIAKDSDAARYAYSMQGFG